jgi:alkanesulfonate monooxygenase SsuD/methylene tetrahydromethanopterin reductase-like flavin-dependent oxidoreductase (luciferase family)
LLPDESGGVNAMKYGLELAAAGPTGDPRSLATYAVLAEDAGWDAIFLEDYVVHWAEGEPTFDPWVSLAAMACATTRIKLGTTVTALPRRRPWIVARHLVTLDHLSGGRVIFGVGIGNDDDADVVGFGEEDNTRARAAKADEGLAILAGMWSGEPFAFDGEHYRVAARTFLPMPIQQPRIPIWIGGTSGRRGPVRRAARWDGMIPVPTNLPGGGTAHLTPEQVAALRDAIAAQRPAGSPFDIVLGGRAREDDWEQERAHIAAVEDAGATWWTEWLPPAGDAVMRAAIARGPLRAPTATA